MTKESKSYDAFVSVVVPLTNAGRTVTTFVLELSTVLQASFRSYEIVLIDNHSVDDTVAQITALQKTTPNLQLFTLNRRNDFEVAIMAGLDNSIGDFVITLNPETDPVELIPRFFAFALDGNEFVCGILREQLHRRMYCWANRQYGKILRATTGISLPAGMSDFRLYSREVLGFVNQNADRQVLLKILPFLATTKIATIEYSAIQPAVSIRRRVTMSFLSSITILLASSSAPLRLLTGMALTVSTLSLLYAGYVIGVAVLKHNVVEGWVSLALPMAVMFFFVSTILGVLAEYVFRMAQHVRNSPLYMISGESTSATSDLQRRLNVVHKDGEFAHASAPDAQSRET
jgi:hypothetical protein